MSLRKRLNFVFLDRYEVYYPDENAAGGKRRVGGAATLELPNGGVYTVILKDGSDASEDPWVRYDIVPASSLSLFWQLPQYVIMTVGEVLFSVSGLSFAYSQVGKHHSQRIVTENDNFTMAYDRVGQKALCISISNPQIKSNKSRHHKNYSKKRLYWRMWAKVFQKNISSRKSSLAGRQSDFVGQELC